MHPRRSIMPLLVLACCTDPIHATIAATRTGAAGLELDIGVKIPNEGTSGPNGMGCTTTNGASSSFTAIARNYGSIKRRNNGNCATSSGTSATEITKPRKDPRTGQLATAGTTITKSIRISAGRAQPVTAR